MTGVIDRNSLIVKNGSTGESRRFPVSEAKFHPGGSASLRVQVDDRAMDVDLDIQTHIHLRAIEDSAKLLEAFGDVDY